MWRQTVVVCALVVGICSEAAGANAPILLEFNDGDLPLIRGVIEAAAARLAHCDCQKVLSDFADGKGVLLSAKLTASGRDAVEAFSSLRFVDSPFARLCRTGNVLAFTSPGSQVVHICSWKFRSRSIRRSVRTEFIMIHEFLHTLGLGENPPTSRDITARVAARCGGRVNIGG